MAVDPSGGLWLSDPSFHDYLDRFSSSGELLLQAEAEHRQVEYGPETRWGIAVSAPTSQVYFDGNKGTALHAETLTASPEIRVLNPDGTLAFSFKGPWGGQGYVNSLTADNSNGPYRGDIYVASAKVGSSPASIYRVTGSGASSPAAAFTACAPVGGNLLTGEETPAGSFSAPDGMPVATDPQGDIYVADNTHHVVDEFAPDGCYLRQFTGEETESGAFGEVSAIAVDPTDGNVVISDALGVHEEGLIDEFTPDGKLVEQITSATLREHVLKVTGQAPYEGPVSMAVSPSGTLYVGLGNTNVPGGFRGGLIQVYGPAPTLPSVTYQPPTEATPTSATVNATVQPTAPGEEVTSCHFEYGTEPKNFNLGTRPCLSDESGHETEELGTPSNPITATTPVHANLSGLNAESDYRFRLSLANSKGQKRQFPEREFALSPPSIESVSSSEVTATSAALEARLNPRGFGITYHFQYGPTTAYGQTTSEAEIAGGLLESHTVKLPLTELQPGLTYHYRLIAENRWGAVTSEDHSFEFFPPSCPNATVRQQTSSNYLPDCRAYELVSPANANGTLFYPSGPATGRATSPARFAFTGAFSSPPEASETIGTDGDLYLATRTDTGWRTHYIGLPGNQASCMGGPPTGTYGYNAAPWWAKSQNTVFADPAMSKLLDFKDGPGIFCFLGGNGAGDADWQLDPASNAPYLFDAEGGLLAHLPDGLGQTPGAAEALSCPYPNSQSVVPHCASELTASPDLNRLFFSSNTAAFTAGGLTEAPGSAYEDNLATGEVSLISTLPNGQPIRSEPAYAATLAAFNEVQRPERQVGPEFLRFPAVSADGSHVLISTATAPTPYCPRATDFVLCPLFTSTPIHLYMHIAGIPGDYQVAEDRITGEPAPVTYVGMTEDGGKVFFTTEKSLLPEDTDTSADLYMWSAAKAQAGEQPLTLISQADPGSPPGAGNSNACQKTSWTQKCGVRPFSNRLFANQLAGLGGNSVSDTAIASRSGEVYFYSPEQLDGSRGTPGLENLYLYRQGALQFVAAFQPGGICPATGESESCRESEDPKETEVGPIARMQVTPDGAHMAFLTQDNVTSYNSHGHLEMYSYTPATGALICDSCNPSGSAPTANVFASQDGLFLTEDGRAFFSTEEALVPRDTNAATDVYEFVDGSPHLITPGTGTATKGGIGERPGLVGVSANGADVYFSTFDSLIPEDHNGSFLKFYDARTNGGFPQPTPAQPCAAAEECHGPGTEAPTLGASGTSAALAGGNATPESPKHRKRHKREGKRHNHRAAHHNRRASR